MCVGGGRAEFFIASRLEYEYVSLKGPLPDISAQGSDLHTELEPPFSCSLLPFTPVSNLTL